MGPKKNAFGELETVGAYVIELSDSMCGGGRASQGGKLGKWMAAFETRIQSILFFMVKTHI